MYVVIKWLNVYIESSDASLRVLNDRHVQVVKESLIKQFQMSQNEEISVFPLSLHVNCVARIQLKFLVSFLSGISHGPAWPWYVLSLWKLITFHLSWQSKSLVWDTTSYVTKRLLAPFRSHHRPPGPQPNLNAPSTATTGFWGGRSQTAGLSRGGDETRATAWGSEREPSPTPALSDDG